jgi:hypothetical protein
VVGSSTARGFRTGWVVGFGYYRRAGSSEGRRLRPKIVAGSIAARQVSWRWAVANVFNSPRLDSRRLSPSGATPAKGAPAEAPRPQNCFCERVSVAKRSVKVLAKTTGRDK